MNLIIKNEKLDALAQLFAQNCDVIDESQKEIRLSYDLSLYIPWRSHHLKLSITDNESSFRLHYVDLNRNFLVSLDKNSPNYDFFKMHLQVGDLSIADIVKDKNSYTNVDRPAPKEWVFAMVRVLNFFQKWEYLTHFLDYVNTSNVFDLTSHERMELSLIAFQQS